METAAKRSRLSRESYGNILTKRADDETSLEVDYLILDYLAWKAVNTCFERSGAECAGDHIESMSAVEDFLKLFRGRYPTIKFDLEMRFRMLLLKVVALLTHRFVHHQCSPALESLRAMRTHNEDRAARWIERPGRRPTFGYDIDLFQRRLPVSPEYLNQRRAHVLDTLGYSARANPYEPVFYGTDECVSFLDVLPLFLQVCTVCRTFYSGTMTDPLKGLINQLMIKACLEQYLVFGAHGSDVIDEAFAWGFRPGEQPGSDDGGPRDHERQLNHLFEYEDNVTEVPGWAEARDKAVALLLQYDASDAPIDEQHDRLVQHLESLDDRYPTGQMDQQLRDFLRQLSSSIDEPVLAQLERGQLKDMSEAETRQFLRTCGPDVTKIFSHV